MCDKIQIEKELNDFKGLSPQAWLAIHAATFPYNLLLAHCPMAPLKAITRGTNKLGRVKILNSAKKTVHFLSLNMRAV